MSGEIPIAFCIPDYGGSFGPHGWKEVYVGEEGWVPFDATSHEMYLIDYASSCMKISIVILFRLQFEINL
jgi:hypothetical protein